MLSFVVASIVLDLSFPHFEHTPVTSYWWEHLISHVLLYTSSFHSSVAEIVIEMPYTPTAVGGAISTASALFGFLS